MQIRCREPDDVWRGDARPSTRTRTRERLGPKVRFSRVKAQKCSSAAPVRSSVQDAVSGAPGPVMVTAGGFDQAMSDERTGRGIGVRFVWGWGGSKREGAVGHPLADASHEAKFRLS